MENTPRSVMNALETLSRERSPGKRQELVESGLTEMIKWFTLAARLILEKKVALPKQTLAFMDRHRDTLQQLADLNVDLNTKRKLILKPGGGGFLGGTIIRTLLRWDGSKAVRKFGPKKAARPKEQTKKTPKKQAKKAPKKQARKTPKKQAKKAPNKRARKPVNERYITIRRKRKPSASGSPKVSPISIRRVSSTPPILMGSRTSTPRSMSSPALARFSPLTSTPSRSRSSTPHKSRQTSTPRRSMTPRNLSSSFGSSLGSSNNSSLNSSLGSSVGSKLSSSQGSSSPYSTSSRFSSIPSIRYPSPHHIELLRGKSPISDAASTAFQALQWYK